MNRKYQALTLLFLFLTGTFGELFAYPIDGYSLTGIRRLVHAKKEIEADDKYRRAPFGARQSMDSLKLNLYGSPFAKELKTLPSEDPELDKALSAMFPNLDESYSIALLDITPGRAPRLAMKQEDRGFQPGSVGKLAVITGLFCELENLFPYNFELRRSLLKSRMVTGGPFAVYDHHTVPIYDIEKDKLTRRQVTVKDVFSLYEWADHMMSVSNNGAAAVVWREVMLMRHFGTDYLCLPQKDMDDFFKDKERGFLRDLSIAAVNEPLRALDIEEEEWRLGTMFTRGASSIVPPEGGSTGSPKGLMKWLVALERGDITDPESSLEIKRLLYMTDRRIRYAGNRQLDSSAVYFKSGSLYKCKDDPRDPCSAYKGNVYNYMNSVVIVESPDGTTYLVALMTNVLRRNSGYDHNVLAGKIDDLVRRVEET